MDSTAKDQAKNKAIERSKHYTNSVTTAALTIDTIHNDRLDIATVAKEITESVQRITGGDISEIEMMLMTQAHTLNVLFHRVLTQIANVEMINHLQTYSDIALRAQNQSRKTLAVLAELKNPKRTTFIRQQNNALNQQVNNNSKNEKQKFSANELLEINNEKRLDTRTPLTSSTADSQLEAVEISRGQDGKR